MASEHSVVEIIIVSQRQPQAYIAANMMVEMERWATWLAKCTGIGVGDCGSGSDHGIFGVFALDGPPTTPLHWIFFFPLRALERILLALKQQRLSAFTLW